MLLSPKAAENRRASQRKYLQKYKYNLKLQAIAALGGRCSQCGISDSRVLQFDHIEPVHTLIYKRGNRVAFFNRIISGEETNVQLLCANCHMIKTAEDMGHYLLVPPGCCAA